MVSLTADGARRRKTTAVTYNGLNEAYAFFNACLFKGDLPNCLITLQRKSKAYGYFAGDRFGSRDGDVVTDEIALNPSHFRVRSTEEVLSTLVHEMAHLWQHRFGKPSRSNYHNKEWGDKMREIGLVPSSTGAPGGKATGQRVSHYIVPGRLNEAVEMWVADHGHGHLYVDLWDTEEAKAQRAKKAASKTRYTCPGCEAHGGGSNRHRAGRGALLCRWPRRRRAMSRLQGACEKDSGSARRSPTAQARRSRPDREAAETGDDCGGRP